MKKIALLLAASLPLLWSCEPEPDALTLLDQFVVQTQYDKTVSFADYSTFAMTTDTIGFFTNTDPNDTLWVETSQASYPRPVLARINQNLSNAGFTRVPKREHPDLGVNVYIVHNLNLYQQVVYPSYYGGYYGYYGSYYGYNYPYVQTSTQNQAQLVIELVDLKNISADKKVKIIWTAVMGDAANAVNLLEQSLAGIDQAFVQSSYIDR